MSMTLPLSHEMERQLRQEAAVKGIAPEAWVQEIIARHQRRVPRWAILTPEEQAGMEALNAELPAAFWKRFRVFSDRSEELSEEERQEFISLIAQTEAWNVRRLEYLESLAQRRGRHFPALMKALGIRHHPLAETDATGA